MVSSLHYSLLQTSKSYLYCISFGNGTSGYMSPEYAVHGVFSTKSDIFSFGVILLEIVSGRKNSTFDDSNSSLNLLGYVSDNIGFGL